MNRGKVKENAPGKPIFSEAKMAHIFRRLELELHRSFVRTSFLGLILPGLGPWLATVRHVR